MLFKIEFDSRFRPLTLMVGYTNTLLCKNEPSYE
ncbi:hypothetical protein AL552_21645 [Vibrio diabolicus]|uniref:Uncharacterized protein n=2 Tax=Vibrio TaxID=662 RepID=A0AAX1XM93_9VIBR|nr:hypothetical protein AL537_01820 [Vibrio diabolicus]MDU9593107.1 hypothetical protein [Vibrio sp. 2-1-2a]MDU9604859.1 hypothetical protein [Vibrio sp. 1-2-3a]MPS37114.1 hypothetical protein [Vibrio sp. VGrn 2]NAW81825.1 hypothetical protein [Vibrio sp. V43_P6S15P86]NKJ68877.1 hypothetical protein [Vibrio chemaguriensis]NNN58762.1 hypothetical protein [Vibrio sp. 1-2 (7-a)]NNN81770.1 hypothetical protein [Vibrio sp. 11-4(1)]PLX65397.1 MAG: hypothetical protein C0632_01580 [Vibrio alginoly